MSNLTLLETESHETSFHSEKPYLNFFFVSLSMKQDTQCADVVKYQFVVTPKPTLQIGYPS